MVVHSTRNKFKIRKSGENILQRDPWKLKFRFMLKKKKKKNVLNEMILTDEY